MLRVSTKPEVALRDALTKFRAAASRINDNDLDSVAKAIDRARDLLDLGAQLFGTSSRAYLELLMIAG